jgi:hypothetical protein
MSYILKIVHPGIIQLNSNIIKRWHFGAQFDKYEGLERSGAPE